MELQWNVVQLFFVTGLSDTKPEQTFDAFDIREQSDEHTLERSRKETI